VAIIYIHGVKVRDPRHAQGLERPFLRWLTPKLAVGSTVPAYLPVFWGDAAAKFRWCLASRPRPWKNVSCDVGDALCFSAVRVEAPEIELARAA
jgi:hypothetical protein